VDDSGFRGNFVLRLDATGNSSPEWAVEFASDHHPQGGIYGVKFVPGATSARGVYITGVMADEVANPGGFEVLIQAKLAPVDGVPDYAATAYAEGVNWGGRDVAVDRAGNAYTADNFGPPGNQNGEVFQWSSTGAFLAFDDFGKSGFNENADGVDLVSDAPGAQVFFAGWTTTPENTPQYPTPSGCDVTYSGNQDGFLVKDNQPLPKLP
jgi:hypothetical protein